MAERDGTYDRCPVCGSLRGHVPTKAERRLLRRVAWCAFWRGFFHPFGAAVGPKGEAGG